MISSFTLDDAGMVPTGVVYVATQRAVPAGSEFLLDYGSSYWDNARQADGSRFDWTDRLVIDYMPPWLDAVQE